MGGGQLREQGVPGGGQLGELGVLGVGPRTEELPSAS